MNEEEMECWGGGVMEYWGIVEEETGGQGPSFQS
jgi:hypothetical protein